MQRDIRSINIDVCDYTNKTLCNLYSNAYDIPGQAHDVYVHTERNGYKEIRFSMPSVLPDGEHNYRMDYLISDYRIKLQIMRPEEIETDWFLISESKITHEAFSTDYEIKASHISSLLNTKNLELEFSDEEGNNVGTIGQIAAAILEGTGWHLGDVRHFYEEEKYGYHDVEKVRSFSASAQTGAFRMISDLCELFDAKPLYHGEGKYIEDGIEKVGRTVDLIPMNPFSKDLEEGSVPQEVLDGEDVLELYYDRNVSNITRTLNTDNIVTKLAAYGSYGDRNGLCSLQEATHTELTFNEPVGVGEYCFEYQNSKFFFTSTAATNSLKWNSLDFSSRSYVYDGENLYRVYKSPKGSYTTLTATETIVKNYVPYIMDFTYYDSVGLLTDDMLQVIANHQTTIPAKHIAATEASIALSSVKESLMKTASAGNGFLMLDIASSAIVDGNLKLTLDKSTYSDGVIFRSDYDESKRNYFSWNVASGIKLNGEAIAGKGAVVYIVHEGSPTYWEKAYVKYIGNLTDNYYRDSLGNTYSLHEKESYESITEFPVYGQAEIIYEAIDINKLYVWFNDNYQEITASDYTYGLNEFDEPSTVTLWASEDTWNVGDKVYMFSADSIAGLFGPREDEVLSNRKSIEETVKTVTEIHPLYFITDNDPIPSPDECLAGYGWYYHSNSTDYNFGDLHFCWGANGDIDWSDVYISRGDENPEEVTPTLQYGYYYSVKRLMLYTPGDKWVPVKGTVDQDKLTANFASVIAGCINQEVLTKGVKEEYYYNQNDIVPVGNYAFKNEFDNYWLFTTRKVINPSEGDQLRYKYSDKLIWQDNDENNVIRVIESPFNVLEFPISNELYGIIYSKGNYDNQTFTTGNTYEISNNIYVHDNVVYEFSLPAGAKIVCLNANNIVTGEKTTSPFTTPSHTTHIRIVSSSVPTSSHYLRIQDYQNVLFSKNVMYKILPCSSSGERMGINYLMDKFIELAHEAYEVKLPELKQAQQDITDANLLLSNTLGDMYREGCWRKDDYVGGDEYKLYADTLDNLKEISHPEATYDITFLDLYGSQPLTEDEESTPWPDIEITYAAHLADPEIDINKWAYIDTLDKCYDQPWKTTLEINTRLSMIGQQSFTDVLAKIAEVANETKANQSIYKRASALTTSGQLAADRLEGAIQTNKLYLLGGTSNWYTDSKGNIIFEAADGNSALMLTGRGLCVAQTKDIYGDWDFRTAITGKGMNADTIYTGYLSAERIEAGSITTDKLAANVGQELEIGSNKALALYATVDGTRPAGSLITQHPNNSDSWIAIGAESDDDPAYIDIQSGGQVNLYGGSEINIESNGALNMTGSTMNLTSQGKMVVNGGEIDIKSAGKLTVASDNFTIQKNTTTGLYDVTISGGVDVGGQSKIAGFTLGVVNKGQASEVNYLYAGQTTSMNTSAKGVYIGNNGINLNGKFKVTDEGYLTATSGEIGGWTINPNKLSSGSGTNYVALSSTDTDYRIWSGNETASSAPFSVKKDGSMKAEKGTIGGWNIGATSLTGSKTGLAYTTLDSDIAIWAGNATASSANFYVRQDGYVYSTNGQIAGWTIKSDYIGNNTTKNTSNVGMASVGPSATNAIVFWAGGNYNGTGNNAPKFSVDRNGKLVASGAEIKGDSTFSGTLSANCINSGTLSATYINGGTLDASKMTVSNLSASSITTGTLDASKVTVSNLSANSITSGTIDASVVSVTNLSASEIKTGDFSASRIKGGTLTLGGSANGNGTLVINDSTGTKIGGWDNAGITAESGTIGGWNILGNSTTKRLYSGSGSTYVALDSGTTNEDYALWVGANSSSDAKFRVKRDGTVVLTQLQIANETSGTTTVNLSDKNSSYPFWKLSYGTVKSLTISGGYCTSMTFSNAVSGSSTVNFKPAAEARNEGWALAANTVTTLSFNSKTHEVFITVPTTTYGQSIMLSDDSNAYNTGFNAVGVKSTGSWSGGYRTITLDNDKTQSVQLPPTGDATWSRSQYGTSGQYIYSCTIGGRTYTHTY